MLVRTHKDAVVVLRVLVQQASPSKVGDHLPANAALFHQVGVHTAHIGVGRRQGEGLRRLLPLWLCGGICRAQFIPQQELHGLLVACSVKVLDKADRMAAPPGNMVVPFVAPDSNMTDPGQPGLPPSAEQLLPPPPQELLQINGVGLLLLFRGKVDIGSREKSPRFWLLSFPGLCKIKETEFDCARRLTMNKQDEILTVSPEQTYHAIRGSIVTAQHSVAKAVNSAMVTAYWEIGEQIYKACGENDRAEYGIRLLEYLSAKLTAEFGKGFSAGARNMRQFYCTF